MEILYESFKISLVSGETDWIAAARETKEEAGLHEVHVYELEISEMFIVLTFHEDGL